MELSKTHREQMDASRRLEKDGRLADAATIYQKLFKSDPTDEQVIGRLLVLYRKLKDYKRELSVLNDAISAYQQRQKAARQDWIQRHPKAAGAGKSMLQQLEKGGYTVTGPGNSVLERWLKRKQLVTGRITGKKPIKTAPPAQNFPPLQIAHRTKAAAPAKTAYRTKAAAPAKTAPRTKAAAPAKTAPRTKAAAPAKTAPRTETAPRTKTAPTAQTASPARTGPRERKEAMASKKQEQRERKAIEASRKKEERQKKKAEVAQAKTEAARVRAESGRKAAEAKRHPSLFLIILRYLVALDEIEAAMQHHMAYLKKHYSNGDFLVSGRQVPRTGGIILARARNRTAIEKIVDQDPFIKRKLASADIIEFTASQFSEGLEEGLTWALHAR